MRKTIATVAASFLLLGTAGAAIATPPAHPVEHPEGDHGHGEHEGDHGHGEKPAH